jgi:hypothetical protein
MSGHNHLMRNLVDMISTQFDKNIELKLRRQIGKLCSKYPIKPGVDAPRILKIENILFNFF